MGINENRYVINESIVSFLRSIGYLLEGKLSFFLIYIGNFLALFYLCIGSFIIWYNLFKNNEHPINKKIIPYYITSFFILITRPLFLIGNFKKNNIIGVSANFNLPKNYIDFSFIYILIIVIIFIFAKKIKNKFRPLLLKLPFVASISYYMFFFIKSIIFFYTSSTLINCNEGNCLYTEVFYFLSSIDVYSPITIYLVDFFQIISRFLEINFFLISMIFYISGYLFILWKLKKMKLNIE